MFLTSSSSCVSNLSPGNLVKLELFEKKCFESRKFRRYFILDIRETSFYPPAFRRLRRVLHGCGGPKFAIWEYYSPICRLCGFYHFMEFGFHGASPQSGQRGAVATRIFIAKLTAFAKNWRGYNFTGAGTVSTQWCRLGSLLPRINSARITKIPSSRYRSRDESPISD